MIRPFRRSTAAVPRLGLYLREIAHGLPVRLRVRPDLAAAAGRDGGGRRVLVIPGFLATDRLTARLRATLDLAGYRSAEWLLGINFGARIDLLDRLVARLEAVAEGERVALVGWSLGGLYARELAKARPDLVERVVTLGAPFSGDPRSNRAWRLYELVNLHAVDAPPITIDRRAKPPVPTIALWSPLDGIVAPASARGLPGEADLAIELACRHLGFCDDPAALAALLDALAIDVSGMR